MPYRQLLLDGLIIEDGEGVACYDIMKSILLKTIHADLFSSKSFLKDLCIILFLRMMPVQSQKCYSECYSLFGKRIVGISSYDGLYALPVPIIVLEC